MQSSTVIVVTCAHPDCKEPAVWLVTTDRGRDLVCCNAHLGEDITEMVDRTAIIRRV